MFKRKEKRERKVWLKGIEIFIFTKEFIYVVRKSCKVPKIEEIEIVMKIFQDLIHSGELGSKFKGRFKEWEWDFIKSKCRQKLSDELNDLIDGVKKVGKIAPLEKRVDRIAREYKISEEEKRKLIEDLKEKKELKNEK